MNSSPNTSVQPLHVLFSRVLCRVADVALIPILWLAPLDARSAGGVLPELTNSLACFYDFEHPVQTNTAMEADLGFSGTPIHLVNGGAVMRTNDGAHVGSLQSLQTQQINPATAGNDDWKAGVYEAGGLESLSAFGSVSGITLMGWVKPLGANPSPNTVTATPGDFYNSIGLFGVLSGTSEGHLVRALVEIISVNNTLRLVALGRRIDNGSSLILAATNDWPTLLPNDTWTHLAATFDFDNGTMEIYRNGLPVAANYTAGGDPWGVIGGDEPDLTSASDPAGIKIGGSFPQNTVERNPFNGRLDDLMFFNRVLDASEVHDQYAHSLAVTSSPVLSISLSGDQTTLSWPASAPEFILETTTNLAPVGWNVATGFPMTNNGVLMHSLPISNHPQAFYRLRKD